MCNPEETKGNSMSATVMAVHVDGVEVRGPETVQDVVEFLVANVDDLMFVEVEVQSPVRGSVVYDGPSLIVIEELNQRRDVNR